MPYASFGRHKIKQRDRPILLEDDAASTLGYQYEQYQIKRIVKNIRATSHSRQEPRDPYYSKLYKRHIQSF